MPLYEKLKNIDRRVIYIFIALSVIIPLVFKIAFTEQASPIVQNIFDKIESLPEGSRVILSYDYSPSTAPEIQPMADALTRHILEKDLRLYNMALWAPGHNIATETTDRIIIAEFPEKVYGEDYLNLGFKAGNEFLIAVILTDLKKMYTTDAKGTDIDSIPMMQGVKNLRNFDLILSLGGGKPGLKEWILFAGDPGHIPVAGGATAVSAPNLYPYYPEQMLGLMGGMKGGAEYESALMKIYPQYKNKSHPGIDLMGPQAIAHLVIMIFVIIGNITYFIARKRGEER
ncbi:MAG: hypothetical protein GF307_14570 [candidate division Zixibacteria bacterium]|nr:hypothetical protein [candidate division Zixibacteria bacterium]